jgi:hypothetical protein
MWKPKEDINKMNEFGKEILLKNYVKNAVGIRVEGVKDILNHKCEKKIVQVDEGETAKGWEFITVRIYLREK